MAVVCMVYGIAVGLMAFASALVGGSSPWIAVTFYSAAGALGYLYASLILVLYRSPPDRDGPTTGPLQF